MRGVNEAVTIGKLINPIIRKAGFNVEDLNSVEEEYEIKAYNGSIFVDRMLKDKSGRPACAVQAKKVGSTHLLDTDVKKTIPYFLKAGILHSIFTDGTEWRIFKEGKHHRTLNLLGKTAKRDQKYLIHFLRYI